MNRLKALLAVSAVLNVFLFFAWSRASHLHAFDVVTAEGSVVIVDDVERGAGSLRIVAPPGKRSVRIRRADGTESELATLRLKGSDTSTFDAATGQQAGEKDSNLAPLEYDGFRIEMPIGTAVSEKTYEL